MLSVKSYTRMLLVTLLIFSCSSWGAHSIISAYFQCAQDEISGVYTSQQNFQEEEDRQRALRIIDIILRNDQAAISAMQLEELNAGEFQLYVDRESLVRYYSGLDEIPEPLVGLWLFGDNALGFALFYAESIDPMNVADRARAIETIKALLARGVSVHAKMGHVYFIRDSRDGAVRDYVPLCDCIERYVSPEILQLLVQHGFVPKHYLHSESLCN